MPFNESFVLVGIILLFVWVSVVTVLVFRMISHYNGLTKGASRTGLKEILESILETQQGLKKKVVELTVELGKTQEAGKLHLERIGIVRFNPFDDTGGTQSFTMALLDGRDNGIVITSLYARNSNRWYVKEITQGTGMDVALSKEEQAAIKKARNL
ncbi:hypothetical protein A3A64_03460 [Candidatus Gottesmanbacteria bacterium RIFCSPLOWO2_01_FULL_48_11]|uniref:DUF4446 domain-containing protein n=2 Tax=Candidatus Gottesmaniibacteriota TaxID=1752720 RepID=A0A0G1U1G9_9BACT|nr:MAG: hypothetical protein UY16_C0016G0001 [Candidatus Gottesmanbacteria bacterium GW2011_GWA2_47_9]OGG28379.1 MAG: hypothetical protein A3A64_03460 [Candidatus Gottesmanbacteria bacterium RIFCSPLOWO2_01_FULL_48_11]